MTGRFGFLLLWKKTHTLFSLGVPPYAVSWRITRDDGSLH
jgi:hypothetical protein